jgi:hypothetical protein
MAGGLLCFRIGRMFAEAAMLVCCGPAIGQGVGTPQRDEEPAREDAAAIAYKLTPSVYFTTNQPTAYDLNFRGNLGSHTAWIGFYRRANEFEQLRIGYENNIEVPFGRITPSIQYATRGFLGGSVNAEIGERYFGIVGIGRTNLKDYFNLNFDPNDAITLGFGTRALPNTTLSAYQVRDDRLGTGQRVFHLVARIKPDDRTRWIFDLFYKEGRATPDDESKVRAAGASVTYDFGRYFMRIALDPNVNFTPEDMLRVSVGLRF